MCDATKFFFVCLLTRFLLHFTCEEIKAKPGDDVTLQCQGPREEAIELLEWSKPDLGSEDYVFYFRDERSYESYQHPLFRGRVELRDPQMKEGDVSVILKNVSISDTGTYKCYFGNAGGPQVITNVTLTVRDSGDRAGDIKDGGKKKRHVGLIVGLAAVGVFVVGVVGLAIFKRHQGQNSEQTPQHTRRRDEVAGASTVSVEEAAEEAGASTVSVEEAGASTVSVEEAGASTVSVEEAGASTVSVEETGASTVSAEETRV